MRTKYLKLVTVAAGMLAGGQAYGEATVATDKLDYAPGEYVVVTGSGWNAGETVELTFDENPVQHTPHVLTAVADENGDFINTDYLIETHDLGTTFVLTAIGQSSGLQAETIFTDGEKCTSGKLGRTCDPATGDLLATCSGLCVLVEGRAQCRAGVPAGVVCRGSDGVCDREEACNGASTSCPSDSKHPEGTVCRAAAGPCDAADTCNGTDTRCSRDVLKSSGEVCRASAGECDIAEVCAGNSASCPADQYRPAGDVCRAEGGGCDLAESCSGSSASCPTDTVKASGEVCRAAGGACDIAESCDGTNKACASDAKVAAGSTCRAAAGECDVAESCDGASDNCPADALKSAIVKCRPAETDENGVNRTCDDDEYCTGSSTSCPPDANPSDDTFAPNLSCAASQVVRTSEQGGVCAASLAVSASAEDICDPTPSVECSAAGLALTAPGGTSASCAAADYAGNQSVMCGVSLTLVDDTAPAVTGPTSVDVGAVCNGAVVTYAGETASDNCDGALDVSCTPASGSTFGLGSTSISCSATDAQGNTGSASTNVSVTYAGTFFLQPINADGSSIFTRKRGSTVPVKFRLSNGACTTAVARLWYAQVSGGVVGTESEPVSTSSADTGNTFRYSAGDGIYIFNLNTMALNVGTYRLRIDLGDGVERTALVSLK